MDVRCDNCQTVYDFDDSKVTTAGVTVKCTQCGHLFKVRRRTITNTNPVLRGPGLGSPEEPPARRQTPGAGVGGDQRRSTITGVPALSGILQVQPGDDRVWLVRSAATGEVRRFRELSTLQQWIAEGKVAREDEISRSGETWRRLNAIAELASLFPETGSAASPPPLPTPPPPPSPRPPRVENNPALLRTVPLAEAPLLPPSLPALQTPLPLPPPPPVGHPPLETPELILGAPPTDTIADDELELPGRRTGRTVLLGLGALLLLVGGSLILVKKYGSSSGATSEAYRRGLEYLAFDTDESLRLADQQLHRARGAAESDPLPIAALAEINGLWAGYLLDDAKLLERTQAAQAELLRKEAQTHLEDGRRYAHEAATLAPEDPDVNRGLAAVLLASAAPANQVETAIARSEAKRPDDPGVAYLRGALLFREGRFTDARTRLEQANQLSRSQGHKELVRVRYLLARVALAEGQREQAKRDGEAVLAQVPRHDRARALLASLLVIPDGGVAPPATVAAATAAPAPHVAVLPPTVAPPSAIPAPTVAAAPTTAPAPTVAGKPAEKPLGEPKGAAVVEPKGYSGLIAQANRLLERGKSKDAQKLFERALVDQPGSLEAQNGLGYCFIDSERFGAAVDQFKQVLQTAPGNGDAIMGIAEAYKMRGDKVRALEFYRRYLAEQPNGPKARMAQTNVLELEQAVKHESPRPSGTEVQDHQLMPPGGTGGN